MSVCNTPSSVELAPGGVIDGDEVAVGAPVPFERNGINPRGNFRDSPQSCGKCGRCNSGNAVNSPSRTWVDIKSDVFVTSEENNVGLLDCVLL